MPMAIKCNLFLNADDTCLVFESKTVKDIQKQLNEDFANIYDWFIDNKQIKLSPSFPSFSLLNVKSRSFRS